MEKFLKLLILPLCLLSSCNNTKKPTTINEEIENTTNLKIGAGLYDIIDINEYEDASSGKSFQIMQKCAYIREENIDILLVLDFFNSSNPTILEVHCYNKKTFPKENFLYYCNKETDFIELVKYIGFPNEISNCCSARKRYYFTDNEENKYIGQLHEDGFSDSLLLVEESLRVTY